MYFKFHAVLSFCNVVFNIEKSAKVNNKSAANGKSKLLIKTF